MPSFSREVIIYHAIYHVRGSLSNRTTLAQEITGTGFPTSRSGIAHLERARPNSYNAELLAAAAYVLRIPPDEVAQGIAQDFRVLYRTLTRQFAARRV